MSRATRQRGRSCFTGSRRAGKPCHHPECAEANRLYQRAWAAAKRARLREEAKDA